MAWLRGISEIIVCIGNLRDQYKYRKLAPLVIRSPTSHHGRIRSTYIRKLAYLWICLGILLGTWTISGQLNMKIVVLQHRRHMGYHQLRRLRMRIVCDVGSTSRFTQLYIVENTSRTYHTKVRDVDRDGQMEVRGMVYNVRQVVTYRLYVITLS